MNYEHLLTSIQKGYYNYIEQIGKRPDVVVMHSTVRQFLVESIKKGWPVYIHTYKPNSDDMYIMGMLIKGSLAIQEHMLVFAPKDIAEIEIKRPDKDDQFKNKGE